MKIAAFPVIAAIVAPALAAKTWDVNIVNGTFTPQELTISPGDTVHWPLNDGASHAIVETNSGARSCNSKASGFNSGTKTQGQAYQQTFHSAGTINYKDGVGANCVKGATGTINVSAKAATATTTTTTTGTKTAAPITSATVKTNSANSFLTPEKSVLLGVACFIGALAL